MNKVFIRNRQIDNNRQLQILLRENDELSDFHEYSNTNRGSQILSGMDKGEETEHHFQEALRELDNGKTTINRAIPIPGVSKCDSYDYIYSSHFKFPNSYIRVKILDLEVEQPDYDMDDRDQSWLGKSDISISKSTFENWIEQFEKASTQKILLLDEAKILLRNESIDAVVKVYDYWLQKRQEAGQSLILSVRAERPERPNNAPVDPYVAFRKRSEKMTTRKNRRVDELSYEKMYRLKHEMNKLSEIIQMVCKRETIKYNKINSDKLIFKKRYELEDFNKIQLKEMENMARKNNSKLLLYNSDSITNQQNHSNYDDFNQKENKRKRPNSKSVELVHAQSYADNEDFTFKPMAKCKYLPSRFSSLNRLFREDLKSDKSAHKPLSDPKKYSYSNLMSLSEKLRYNLMNNPVRYRTNREGKVIIDLQSHLVHSNTGSHNHNESSNIDNKSFDINSSDNIRPEPNKSDSLPISYSALQSYLNFIAKTHQGPSIKQDFVRRLISLCHSNVYCGLKPLHTLENDHFSNNLPIVNDINCPNSSTNYLKSPNNCTPRSSYPNNNRKRTFNNSNDNHQISDKMYPKIRNIYDNVSTDDSRQQLVSQNNTNHKLPPLPNDTNLSERNSENISMNNSSNNRPNHLKSNSYNRNKPNTFNTYQNQNFINNGIDIKSEKNNMCPILQSQNVNNQSSNGLKHTMIHKELVTDDCSQQDSGFSLHHNLDQPADTVMMHQKIKNEPTNIKPPDSDLGSITTNSNHNFFKSHTNSNSLSASTSSSSSPDAGSLVSTETNSTTPLMSDYSSVINQLSHQNSFTKSNGHSNNGFNFNIKTSNYSITHPPNKVPSNNNSSKHSLSQNKTSHNHHHNQPHSNNRLNHHVQKKWLTNTNSQTDAFLKSSDLVPLWKTDQHVVSGINKLT